LKISVITAVYNRANTVADAIESVCGQTYGNLEHIVQDGGSTDGSLARIAVSSHDRMGLVSEPDGGIYDALNRGILRSTGDVVGFMHSDDLYAHPEVLARVAEVFEDPAVDGVYGDLDYVAADEPTRVIRHWTSGSFQASRLKWGWMPPHPTLYLRRHVYDQFGLYDASFRIAADYDAMLRYMTRGRINLAYIPEVLVKMRVGGESNKSLRRILLKSSEDMRALKNNRLGGVGTLAAKNFRKIPQFFLKAQ
jgi:glycosyltransferase involved in cell wall biosynthesis